MATKQEKAAIKSAVTRERKKGIVREEKHVLWLLIAIIIILLYLLLAQWQGWWPYARPKLGSAFYTNIAANTPMKEAPSDSSNTGGGSDAGGNSGGGSNTGSSGNTGGGSGGGSNGGSSGNNGGGGSPTTPPASSDSIADLAANVNVGDSKVQVNGHANNLGAGCAVLVDAQAQTIGKQEVCTYSQGDKIVTVTYLNDRVISASKSGF